MCDFTVLRYDSMTLLRPSSHAESEGGQDPGTL